ncbi:PqqD family peptide modification chaperone [Chelativorans salis]|uniref:PqqD family protein n=1 Tax=Chelativorans salis TaxID=2978478 RepID=A0ABT2LW73_9HYPH|nr:PqqD family protein [Chelativorans sp. EGI FJ00035]MCT7377848.1 PqqD family protein [Chelativorans sp. EGI FJ00035]
MLARCALIERPLLFDATEEVFEVLLSITDGWQFESILEPAEALIRVVRGGSGFRIEEEDHQPFCEDSAVSAACCLVAILLNRLVENDADCLCLHAGAVSMGGQTLVFPNTHRAGKSTLATALAFQGAKLVSDDILPLDCTGAKIRAIASGVAPRLRLPLAPSLGLRFGFSAWRLAGADDGYYRYIRLPSSSRAPLGARRELGAFIFLERGAEHAKRQLFSVSKASAMRMLLLQNFGTAAPPGTILDRIDRLTDDNPAFLLRYRDLADAVSLLRRHFPGTVASRTLWSGLKHAEPALSETERLEARQPDPFRLANCAIRHSEGIILREAEGLIFLVDGENGGIFALDQVGAAIWKFLEEAASLREITDAVSAAYPDIEPGQIATDVENLIRALWAKQLVQLAN